MYCCAAWHGAKQNEVSSTQVRIYVQLTQAVAYVLCYEVLFGQSFKPTGEQDIPLRDVCLPEFLCTDLRHFQRPKVDNQHMTMNMTMTTMPCLCGQGRLSDACTMRRCAAHMAMQ